jgi:hypothetical protein
VFTAASVLLHQISLKANSILLSTVSFRIVIPLSSEVLFYNINPNLGPRQRTLTGLISLVLQYFSFLRARSEPVESNFSFLAGPTQNIKVCCTWVLCHSRTKILHALVTYQLTTIYQYQKEIKPIASPCNSVKSQINW